MGLKGSPTHAVTYQDVRVPLDNLIGEAGRGLQQTFATLDGGKVIKVTGTLGTDYAFSAFVEGEAAADEMRVKGTAAAVQVRPGLTMPSLGAPGDVRRGA